MRLRIRAWYESGWVTRFLYYGIAAVVIAFDQLTKVWVVANLPEYQPVNVFGWLAPILSFTSVRNTGVAFGLFPSLGDLFTLLSALVVLGIVIFRRTLPSNATFIHVALGLVTGGALGNVIDRVIRGYVVDFLDVNFRPLASWPVFNLADSAVVVGVVILLIDSFLTQPDSVKPDA